MFDPELSPTLLSRWVQTMEASISAKRTRAHKHGRPLPPARSRLAPQPEAVAIPDKLYFRIGEVSELCQLPASVLRFWESEFSQLKPVKSSTGQRMYRRPDVESVLRIRDLLYGRGYTIAGARQFLGAEKKAGRSQATLPFPSVHSSRLRGIRKEVCDLLVLLNRKAQ